MTRCRGCWTVLLLLCLTTLASAQFELVFPPSPQANGRGGIYPTGQTDDPLASLSNPALLGLMAERNQVMAAFYPHHAEWHPFSVLTIGYASRALAYGFDRPTLGKFFDCKTPFSFGIGYQEAMLDLGETQRTDEYGNSLGSFKATKVQRGLTLGIGYHHARGQAALGLSHGWAHHALGFSDATLRPTNLGLYGELFLERWRYPSPPVYAAPHLITQPFLHLSGGYALLNLGPAYRYHESSDEFQSLSSDPEPMPRTARLSLGFSTGLKASHPLADEWELISVAAGIQVQDALVDYSGADGYKYRGPLGGIRPLKELVLGQSDRDIGISKGFELGLMETFYIRSGRANDASPWAWYDMQVSGYGLRLSGILKLIALDPARRQDGTFTAILKHLDIAYDHAAFAESGSSLDGTTLNQLSLRYTH